MIMLNFLFFTVFSFHNTDNGLRIGILKQIKDCNKTVIHDDKIYAFVTARIKGRDDIIFDNTDSGATLYHVNSTTYIEGFNKGLIGACEGEVRRLTIPPEMAYGKEHVEGLFEPYSTWVVDVEIVEIISRREI